MSCTLSIVNKGTEWKCVKVLNAFSLFFYILSFFYSTQSLFVCNLKQLETPTPLFDLFASLKS